MIARLIVMLIAAAEGGYMIVDGIYALASGHYIGGPNVGAWGSIVASVGIEPAKMPFAFVVFGTFWIDALVGVAARRQWGWIVALLAAVVTLWYAPFGTLLSLIAILTLVVARGSFARDAAA